MDKDRCVSIETISAQFDVSVGTVHTVIHEELKMGKMCAKFVPKVLREDQKERFCHDSREMVELINWDPSVLDALVKCDESWINCYDPETKRQGSQWKHAGSPRPKKARQSRSNQKFWWSLFWQHWHDLHALGSHWTDSQQGILCWGFKGVQEEIPSEEANTLQIESVAFQPGKIANRSDFKRDEIIGSCMADASVTKTAELFGVVRCSASKVTAVFEKEGKTSSLKKNSGRNEICLTVTVGLLRGLFRRNTKIQLRKLQKNLMTISKIEFPQKL